jgi:hypothetical protein
MYIVPGSEVLDDDWPPGLGYDEYCDVTFFACGPDCTADNGYPVDVDEGGGAPDGWCGWW